jgi:hypothetical protein
VDGMRCTHNVRNIALAFTALFARPGTERPNRKRPASSLLGHLANRMRPEGPA